MHPRKPSFSESYFGAAGPRAGFCAVRAGNLESRRLQRLPLRLRADGLWEDLHHAGRCRGGGHHPHALHGTLPGDSGGGILRSWGVSTKASEAEILSRGCFLPSNLFLVLGFPFGLLPRKGVLARFLWIRCLKSTPGLLLALTLHAFVFRYES